MIELSRFRYFTSITGKYTLYGGRMSSCARRSEVLLAMPILLTITDMGLEMVFQSDGKV